VHSRVPYIGARKTTYRILMSALDVLTVITGVSGSGKSTLIKKILFPAMLDNVGEAGQFTEISGSFSQIKHIEYVDQNPIGSSRSNPVTYIVYDDIRDLFSKEKLSKIRVICPNIFF
jgi:excinuclease ABC subunit A